MTETSPPPTGGRQNGTGNNNGNGSRYNDKKKPEKKPEFPNKIENMLTLRLPAEGGMITQYSSFFQSLQTYASTSIGKNLASVWISDYLQSGNSKWTPANPKAPAEADFNDSAGKLVQAEYDDAVLDYDEERKAIRECKFSLWMPAKQRLFGSIESNLSKNFKAEIQSLSFYKTARQENDSIELLRQCEILAGGASAHAFEALTTATAYKEFFTCRQKYQQSVYDYYTELKARRDKLKQVHGDLDGYEFKWTLQGRQVSSKEAVVVAQFFEGLHDTYSTNKLLLRQNREYPTTLQKAYETASMWEDEAQKEQKKKKKNDNNNNNNRRGRANDSNDGVSSYSNLGEVCLAMYDEDEDKLLLPSDWILLDTCASTTVFRSERYFEKIRPSAVPTVVSSTGGTAYTH